MSELAAKLGEKNPQVISNWRKRGVPFKKINAVVKAMKDLGHELPIGIAAVGEPGTQYTLEAESFIDDFRHLPSGLQEHIARKTAELRAYADALPKFLRDSVKPPSDPEHYLAWERDMEADMHRRKSQDAKVVQLPQKKR